MRFSKHDKKGLGKKYVDNERLWLKTEDMVRNAMLNGGVPFVEVEDEAAFYGPSRHDFASLANLAQTNELPR